MGYASFLLGAVASASAKAVQDPQWRKNAWALYIQDNWKITRKLTLDLGLRWDLQGLGHEIWWRNSMFGPTIPNPSAGNRPGAVVYEGYGTGRCNCQFTSTYPYAVGPRIGAAYQINAKTVFRAAWGIAYGPGPNWWYITNSGTINGVGFDTYNTPATAFDQSALTLKNGLAPMYNLQALYTPTLLPGLGITPGTVGTIGTYYDRNGGRPQRVNQWNIAV